MFCLFFFQAEDGIRDGHVTGVQTCALPICFTLAIEVGDDPDVREWAAYMMLVARALERIGDNAVDVGEQVAFVVTGLFREFSDASHPASARPDAAPSSGPG